MTTANPAATQSKQHGYIRFPDPPERTPEMTTFNHLSLTGNVHFLMHHLGNPETTLVAGEHYLAIAPTTDMTGLRYPDLLIAFNVNPAAYYQRNAYVISEQGKPPDFVLEIASPGTRGADNTGKRRDYAELGITEYWRFDEIHRPRSPYPRLAADRLTDGEYRPLEMEEIAEGVLQGYSPALNLHLRWENGQLKWHDPTTGRHITTLADERARANREQQARIQAEIRARREQEARIQSEARARREQEIRTHAETRARNEQDARIRAEARAREMEAELNRLRGQ